MAELPIDRGADIRVKNNDDLPRPPDFVNPVHPPEADVVPGIASP